MDESLDDLLLEGLQNEVSLVTETEDGFHPLAFNNAVEFIYEFDRSLKEGKKTLHRWQEETLLFLSKRYENKYTIDTPLVFNLLACNGSGKDAFVIAGFAVFVLCCWKRYKVVITSSSDEQLDTQTRSYITNLCNEVNTRLRTEWGIPEVIKVKIETFKCRNFLQANGKRISLTGSEILTFVTKEGGKAEGHHPYPDASPGEGVILIANEAKTIPQEIFDHFGKCTYNIFLKVSSSGQAKEHFYKSFTNARDWNNGYIPGVPYKRKITYKDCPHLSESRIATEIAEHGGEDSPWFRMTRKSEFVSLDEAVVIASYILDICLQRPKKKLSLGHPRKAGLDIGGGGDPSSLWVFDENICLGKHTWNYRDTQLTVDKLCGTKDEIGLFQRYELKPEDITGDDNGLGQAVIDALYRRKINPLDTRDNAPTWTIRRVRAQFAATNKIKYLNKGAEWWFRVLRLIEECIIDFNGFLQEGDDVYRQLTSRHYNETNGKFKLWTKEEERSDGNPSPNDADAIVLALSQYDVYEFIDYGKKIETNNKPRTSPELLGSLRLIEEIQQLVKNEKQFDQYDLLKQSLREQDIKKPQQQKSLITAIESLYG